MRRSQVWSVITGFAVVSIWLGVVGAAPLAPAPHPILTDSDRLPPGAVARLGTARFRGASYWNRAVASRECNVIILTDSSDAASVDYSSGKINWKATLAPPAVSNSPWLLRGKRVVGMSTKSLFVLDAHQGRPIAVRDGKPFGGPQPLRTGPVSASEDGLVVAFAVHEYQSLGPAWVVQLGKVPAAAALGPAGERHSVIGVSPDGRSVVMDGFTANSDKSHIEVWDVGSQSRRFRLDVERPGDIVQVVFSSQSDRVLLVDAESQGQVWDIKTGKLIHELQQVHDPHRSTSWAFSHDGATVACQHLSGVVWTWDVTTGKRLAKHDPPACITAGFGRQNLRGKSLLETREHGLVALGSVGESVVAWVVESGRILTPVVGPFYEAKHLRFTPDGASLVFAQPGAEVMQWVIRSRKANSVFVGRPENVGSDFAKGGDICAISPDGTLCAVGRGNGKEAFVVVELATGRVLSRVERAPGQDRGIPQVVFSPTNTFVASGAMMSTRPPLKEPLHLPVAAPPEGSPHQNIKLPVCGSVVCGISPDGSRLVAKGRVRRVAEMPEDFTSLTAWDIKTAEEINRAVIPRCVPTTAVPVTRDDHVLLTREGRGDRHELVSWHIPSGKVESRGLVPPPTTVVVSSPDGKLIAFGIREGGTGESAVRVCRWPSCENIVDLRGHSRDVEEVAFSPDSMRLATSARDSTIIVWDIKH